MMNLKLIPLLLILILLPTLSFSQNDSVPLNLKDSLGRKVGYWSEKITKKRETYIFKSYYVDGLKNGKHEVYSTDGKLVVVSHYKNDTLNGIHKDFYENGQIHHKIVYVDGKINGIYKSYYENGNPDEYKYKRNDSIISWIWYHKNGQVRIHSYQDSTDQSIRHLIEYYENGVIKGKVTRVNGKNHGYYFKYSQEGILTEKILYQKGEIVQ